MIPVIQNVVATFSLGRRLDLAELTKVTGFMQYNPSKFAAAMVRLRDPATTCMVFASGKVVCTGARSEQLACITSHKLVHLFSRKGVGLHMQGFVVQNIVSVVYCPFQLDLQRIAQHVSGICNYEPSMFPGLIYKQHVQTQTIVFICFQSGRCIVTGGKTRASVLVAWQSFYRDVLRVHKSSIDYGSAGNYHMYQKQSKSAENSTTVQHTLFDLSSRVSDLLRNHPLSLEFDYERLRAIRLEAEVTPQSEHTEEQVRVLEALEAIGAADLVSARQAGLSRVHVAEMKIEPGVGSYTPVRLRTKPPESSAELGR